MVKLVSFQEAVEDSKQYAKRHLLLGNGFSIGCRADVFHYSSLFEEADFSSIPETREIFDALGTHDFEEAIRALEDAALVMPVYVDKAGDIVSRMKSHAEALKNILVETIANNHPDLPMSISDESYWNCRQFLANFLAGEKCGQVYTLNYDLLLYWVLMHDDVPFDDEPIELKKNDGFGNDEEDDEADYVVWHGETKANKQSVHYLHGALHLYDAGNELKKYTWKRRRIPLVEQARAAINEKAYPLFVSESISSKKKRKIRHNAYLYHSYKSLVSNANQTKPCFFIYGHSLAENDNHILNWFSKGRFPKLYVGIYGDPESENNKLIISRSKIIATKRDSRSPLSITFYDAASADVWGNE